MPIEVEEKTPGELSAAGNCGIKHTVDCYARFMYVFGGGVTPTKEYTFNLNYTRVEGCHGVFFFTEPAGSPGMGFMTFTPYGDPVITDLGNGVKKATYYVNFQLSLQDYCGICYNPENVAVSNLSQYANSVNAAEAPEALDGFTKLTRLLGGLEAGKDGRNGGRISIPDARRRLRDFFRLFDLNGQLSDDVPGDPCANRSLCDLTP